MRSAKGEIDCSDVVLFILVTKDKLNRSDALLSGYLEILNLLDLTVQKKNNQKITFIFYTYSHFKPVWPRHIIKPNEHMGCVKLQNDKEKSHHISIIKMFHIVQ